MRRTTLPLYLTASAASLFGNAAIGIALPCSVSSTDTIGPCTPWPMPASTMPSIGSQKPKGCAAGSSVS